MTGAETPAAQGNFIREIIDEDLREGRHRRVVTRFPPEPNGYLHIGHAKSICLNFGLAADYGGVCHLRFDDTNPAKEDEEYVNSIMADVRWLGFAWGDKLFYASDYFGRLHEFAVELIKAGKAYVCHLSPDEVREYRGTLTEPGRPSPWRDRPAAESLELFARMGRGELEEGACVLRAKIDMASPNITMRDPTIYRIRKSPPHHRTGGRWCIYPMYDFAHCLSDAIEGITHSICTLEFENNRPLYDWILDQLPVPCHPRQIEFARLSLSYTVMSKRKLLELVRTGVVAGWDDPRLPTLSGLRRRGYTPESIRTFCDRIGVAKKRDTRVEAAVLEDCLREDLNRRAPRAMAVLRPLEVVLENYPEGESEAFAVEVNPEDPSQGTRMVPFGRRLYIERDDFSPEPPPKFHRLAPGREVRLKQAYFIRCTGFERDPATGEVARVKCTVDPASRGGEAPDGRRPKATLHWVAAAGAVPAEVRLYDHLFAKEDPEEAGPGESYLDAINPASLEVVRGCLVEPGLAGAEAGSRWQFLRHGYFVADAVDSRPGRLVFNRIATLRDTWARAQGGRG